MYKVKKKIPLAYFAYNRPEHTERSLTSLSKCNSKDLYDFYFFSDASYDESNKLKVEEVRRILRSKAKYFSASLVERPNNLGLSKSIVSGVSGLTETYGKVVVLEDDLELSPEFLTFMAAALEHYENDHEIMQVGAYTIAEPKGLEMDAFFLPITTTWGWATWHRAWKQFSWTPKDYPNILENKEWTSLFNVNGATDYLSMLEDRLAGRNDSWGILWWYVVSKAKGKVVYPCKTLVTNFGFDGSGVHCGAGGENQFGINKLNNSSFQNPVYFPSNKMVREIDWLALEETLRGAPRPYFGLKSRFQKIFKESARRIKNAIY